MGQIGHEFEPVGAAAHLRSRQRWPPPPPGGRLGAAHGGYQPRRLPWRHGARAPALGEFGAPAPEPEQQMEAASPAEVRAALVGAIGEVLTPSIADGLKLSVVVATDDNLVAVRERAQPTVELFHGYTACMMVGVAVLGNRSVPCEDVACMTQNVAVRHLDETMFSVSVADVDDPLAAARAQRQLREWNDLGSACRSRHV